MVGSGAMQSKKRVTSPSVGFIENGPPVGYEIIMSGLKECKLFCKPENSLRSLDRGVIRVPF